MSHEMMKMRGFIVMLVKNLELVYFGFHGGDLIEVG